MAILNGAIEAGALKFATGANRLKTYDKLHFVVAVAIQSFETLIQLLAITTTQYHHFE